MSNATQQYTGRLYTQAEVDEMLEGASQDFRICGKTVDEIVPILSGLEIERATEITLTMANLRKLYDKLIEEQQEMLSHAINSTLDRARLERRELSKEPDTTQFDAFTNRDEWQAKLDKLPGVDGA